MANTYNINIPLSPNGTQLDSVTLKQVGTNYYAYAAGSNTTSPIVPFTAVKGMVFSNSTDAQNALSAASPDGTWADASLVPPGAGYVYNFGSGSGNGTIPGAQPGDSNWIVVLAQFQGSTTWSPAASDGYQFKGG